MVAVVHRGSRPQSLLDASYTVDRSHWLARELVWAPRPVAGGWVVDPASGAVCARLGNATTAIADDDSAIATSYDGSGDGWDTPSPANPSATGQYTLACWINIAIATTSDVLQVEGYDALLLRFQATSSTVRWGHKNASGTFIGPSVTGAWTANTTTHYAMTYDGATQRLYRDGAQVGTNSVGGGLLSQTADWRIGIHSGGSANPTNGRVWRVYGWTRALGADEVAALYAGVDLELWSRRRLFLLPSAAPSGFQPAWAARSTVTIVGGVAA